MRGYDNKTIDIELKTRKVKKPNNYVEEKQFGEKIDYKTFIEAGGNIEGLAGHI